MDLGFIQYRARKKWPHRGSNGAAYWLPGVRCQKILKPDTRNLNTGSLLHQAGPITGSEPILMLFLEPTLVAFGLDPAVKKDQGVEIAFA